MFSLHQLPKTTIKSKKRLGRGYGSTKGGHTSSRGQKGQKSRTTAKLLFEGTKSNKDFFRKVPMIRGKGKLKSHTKKPVIVKTSQLETMKAEKITLEYLVKSKLITEKQAHQKGVKVLFDKPISKKMELDLPASKAVQKSMTVPKE